MRDANIKKLSKLLEAEGIKVSMINMPTQTDNPKYDSQSVQVDEEQEDDGALTKII